MPINNNDRILLSRCKELNQECYYNVKVYYSHGGGFRGNGEEYVLTNKIFVFLRFPFLQAVLSECDCLIVDQAQEQDQKNDYLKMSSKVVVNEGDETGVGGGNEDGSATSTKSMTTPRPAEPLCSECGKLFKSETKLRKHMFNTHPDQTFTCHICDKTFKRKHHFAQHLVIHESNSDNYGCKFCESKFKHKRSLNEHMRVHLVPIKCKLCSKVFYSNSNLQRHVKRIHSSG